LSKTRTITKTSGTVKAIAALAVLSLVGVVLWTGYQTDWTWKFQITPGEPPTGTWKGGTYRLTVAGRDTLDSSASLVVGTDFTGSWYGYRSSKYVFLGVGSSSGADVESKAEDDGYIYLKVEEISTKYYFSDPMATVDYTYIKSYSWLDIDNDLEKEFVYKCSLWDIAKSGDYYPRTFYASFKAESSQGTAANALQWQTSPTDISSIGTSTVTKYVGWETKLTAAKRAVGIYKVVLSVNSTSTTKWEITSLNIPGVGLISGSALDEQVLSSTTTYTYEVGTADFDNVLYWYISSGQNNKFDNTLAVKCKFGSGEAYTFTLYIYQLLYDRTTVSDNDPVVLSA